MKKFVQINILSKNTKEFDGRIKRRTLSEYHYCSSGLIYIRLSRLRVAFNWKENIARTLHHLKIKPCWSTNIAEQYSCGYGKLDNNGFWQFPLPEHMIKRKLAKIKENH
jgi:hypothetical protein